MPHTLATPVTRRHALLTALSLGAMAAPLKPVVAALPAPRPRQDNVDIEIVVLSDAVDKGGLVGSMAEMALAAKTWALGASTNLAASGGIAIAIGGVLVFSGVGAEVGIDLIGFGIFCEILSYWLHQIANDPPQPDYAQPVRLSLMHIGLPPHAAGLPETVKAIRAGSALIPVAHGLLDALERIGGAHAAGDAAAERRQQRAFEQLLYLYSALIEQFGRAATQLGKNLTVNARVTPDAVRTFQGILIDPTWNPVFRKLFTDFGVPEGLLPFLEQQVSRLNPRAATAGTIQEHLKRTGAALKAQGGTLGDLLYQFG